MEFFRRIGFALAFSPTSEALLAETAWLTNLFRAELVLIHVGPSGQKEAQLVSYLLERVGLSEKNVKIIWEQGDPAERILKTCQKEKIDLLVAGALSRENIVKYYIGTIARKIMRRADCSLMMIINPSGQHVPIKNIVVNAEDSPYVEEALQSACELGKAGDSAWIHVVREIKLYGLAMSATSQHSEEEYSDIKQQLLRDEIEHVDKMLSKIPHEDLKINVKMLSGKSGFELCKFAQRKQADWLVVGAPARRFKLFDRVFPHDLEYVFADLPCNLLIVHPRKEGHRG
jgi:nucleotide-binding universal stress UspA family protein